MRSEFQIGQKLFILPVLLCLVLLSCNLSQRMLEPLEEENEQTETPMEHFDSPAGVETRSSVLESVKTWLYLIDSALDTTLVESIRDSTYDLVVIDFARSEEGNTDFPMLEVIQNIKSGSHQKIVLAYIDIGEAEAYRTYWQPGWDIGDPEWIIGEDPDGWEENFPVAYWRDEWKEIWTGEEGYLDRIIEDGFDGVYLDWVEAYSDEFVMDVAERDGVEPIQEMIWWVTEIADFCRKRSSDFIVIAQNAAELAEFSDYIGTIDAIAQEQVWFDGGADNDPPGDCPLPRTESLVDSDEYEQSLSPRCLRQYDEFPDSTLHTSSEEYLYYLNLAHEQGLPIFTVDYAQEPENVQWVYAASRSLGFIPFVGNRALNQFVEPYRP